MTSVKLDAATFAHRILKHMSAFKAADDIGVPRDLANVIPTDQVVLGIYENNVNSFEHAVVVTNVSLWVLSAGKAEETRYDEIASVRWWPDQKRQANSVRISLHDGVTKLVPVRGELGGGRDVFEFVRFLSRVIGELGKAAH